MQIIVATHSMYPLMHKSKFNIIESQEGYVQRPAIAGQDEPYVRLHRPGDRRYRNRGPLGDEQAGENVEEIATEFGIPQDSVLWALAYQTSARAA